jgi:pimeloyl-ACP methyl ester carboxylesterase
MSSPSSVVATVNGLDLCVGLPSEWSVAPEPKRREGMPVLFVHGFSHEHGVWDDVAAMLPPGFRSVALDLRGHGDSDWSLEGAYRPSDHARDLASLLDVLHIERAVVVGHSLGGNASTLLAAQQPDRVAALVLVDTGPTLSGAAWQTAAGDAALAMGCFPDVESYRRVLGLAYPFGRPEAVDRMARNGLVRRVDGRFEPKLDPLLLEQTGSASEWADNESALWAALGKIQCPTLVVRGERSAMLAADVAREMVENVLDRGRQVGVANAGHAVAVDNPAGLGEAVAAFLQEPEVRAHLRAGERGVPH